jgi:flavin-dependent dehydrogenase
MQQFDAIVVGAGPAGSSAALAMARAGLQVALIERGEYPGAKNVSGAGLYSVRQWRIFFAQTASRVARSDALFSTPSAARYRY